MSDLKAKRMNLQILVDQITYKNWSFYIGRKGEVFYLQIHFLAADNEAGTDSLAVQKGRKWMLSEFMTKSELVQTALKAVITAEEHETRELFLYRNKPVFAPHFDVEDLHRIYTEEHQDVRTTNRKK